MLCWLLLPAASVACMWLFRVSHSIYIYIHIYIYIYIYICVCVCVLCGLCARVYIAIYAYIQGIYAYIEPWKYIYRSYIYVCHVCLFPFMYYVCCIYANGYKLVQMHAPLHINAPLYEESCPWLCAAKLTYINGTKGDQASYQWLD